MKTYLLCLWNTICVEDNINKSQPKPIRYFFPDGEQVQDIAQTYGIYTPDRKQVQDID